MSEKLLKVNGNIITYKKWHFKNETGNDGYFETETLVYKSIISITTRDKDEFIVCKGNDGIDIYSLDNQRRILSKLPEDNTVIRIFSVTGTVLSPFICVTNGNKKKIYDKSGYLLNSTEDENVDLDVEFHARDAFLTEFNKVTGKKRMWNMEGFEVYTK